MLYKRSEAMSVASANFKPSHIAFMQLLQIGLMPNKERHQNALGWPLKKHCRVGEQKIAVRHFDIARDEPFRITIRAKHNSKIDYA